MVPSSCTPWQGSVSGTQCSPLYSTALCPLKMASQSAPCTPLGWGPYWWGHPHSTQAQLKIGQACSSMYMWFLCILFEKIKETEKLI